MTLKNFIRNYWILLFLVAVKLILQFVYVNPVYELHRDEFLHLDQAFHPAAGYISVPPFTSWIACLIHLLGGGLFWIRFFPAFFGALTIVFAWLIVEEAGGSLYARILTSVLLTFSVLVRINLLFQPNSFEIAFWTIIFYLLIKYLHTQQARWLFLCALFTVLAFYTKYNILFLLAGLFAGLMMTERRDLFTKKIFYLALGCSLILLLPNIIWQIRNSFPVFRHMAALKETQLVNVGRARFILDQFKYGMLGLVTISALWAFMFYKPFRQYRFIGWTYIIAILCYVVLKGKSYYPLGLYPVLFALGSVFLEVVFKKWKVIGISLISVLRVIVFFFMAKYLMPYRSPSDIAANGYIYEKSGMLRWEDGRNHTLPQDFADMIGWREMADKALAGYKMIPEEEKKNTLVFCDNYGETGALNYYNHGKMPEAYSFNTDYIYWLPEVTDIKNIVLVGDEPDGHFSNMLSEIITVGEVTNEYAREKGIRIFILKVGDPGFTKAFYKRAEERKKGFDIF